MDALYEQLKQLEQEFGSMQMIDALSKAAQDDLQTIETAKRRVAEERGRPQVPIEFGNPHLEIMLREMERDKIAKTENQANKNNAILSHLKTYCGDEKYCSVADLQHLERVDLNQMLARKRHVGRYLLCQVVSKPYAQVGIQIIVQSPSGRTLLCSVYNYPSYPRSLSPPTLADLDTLFPVGQILAIKEPWIKMSLGDGPKKPMLRVDSPTDIVFIERSEHFRDGPSIELRSVIEWKTLGNKLFEEKKYLQAKHAYSEGIKQDPALSSSYQLFLNRALMSMHLQLFNSSLQDCNKVIDFLRSNATTTTTTSNPFLEKALFRRASSLYSLRRWKEALAGYSEYLTLNPDSEDCKKEICRVQQRIKEASSGEYDIRALYKASQTKVDMDVADYYGNVKIALMPERGGGRGVIATADIVPGDILIANKAISYGTVDLKQLISSFNFITNIVDTPEAVALRQNIIYKLLAQPELAKSVYSLYSGKGHNAIEIEMATLSELSNNVNETVIDAGLIEKVSDDSHSTSYFDLPNICSLNSFAVHSLEKFGQESKKKLPVSCLFVGTSFINHSCYYNAKKRLEIFKLSELRSIYQKTLKYATQNMSGKVFISYCSEGPHNERAEAISRYLVDKCTCPLCEADRFDGKENLVKRSKVREAIMDDHQGEPRSVKAAKQLLYRREGFVKEMESTYRPGREVNSPDLLVAYKGLAFAFGCLSILTHDRGLLLRQMKFETKALESIGVVLSKNSDPKKDALPIVRGPFWHHSDAVITMILLSKSYLATGHKKECLGWLKAAVWVHNSSFGGGTSMFKELFQDLLVDMDEYLSMCGGVTNM